MFLITGASSGVGAALAKILYSANAKVYVAARSEQKAQGAIDAIKAAHPDSRGQLIFHSLDLADLATIRRSAEAFLAAEQRLDVLWLNAGVMIPPQGSKTAQGWELQLGTNNLGHFLFARYLRPALQAAATTAPKGSVRIVWVSSSAVDIPGKPAIDFENINYDKKNESSWMKYGRSKVGNVLHCKQVPDQVSASSHIADWVALRQPWSLRAGSRKMASSAWYARTSTDRGAEVDVL